MLQFVTLSNLFLTFFFSISQLVSQFVSQMVLHGKKTLFCTKRFDSVRNSHTPEDPERRRAVLAAFQKHFCWPHLQSHVKVVKTLPWYLLKHSTSLYEGTKLFCETQSKIICNSFFSTNWNIGIPAPCPSLSWSLISAISPCTQVPLVLSKV
jgi:hypothetical protein